MFKLIDKKIITILCSKNLLGPMEGATFTCVNGTVSCFGNKLTKYWPTVYKLQHLTSAMVYK